MAAKKKEAAEPVKAGHNLRQQVKSYIERAENIDAEMDTLREDKKELWAEAKMSGLNPGALKGLVAQRRRDRKPPTIKQIEMKALMAEYEAALGE